MPPTSEQIRRIHTENLGLRVGIDTDGAAYSMADFGSGELMEIILWTINPTGNRLQAWEDHLYNTIWLIDDIAGQSYNLLIVSRAPYTAENYFAAGGRGDMRTFRKCNHLSSASAIVAQQTFNHGQIPQSINWILNNI